MMAEEPYVGKPLVRFREGRGGNWAKVREHPVYSTPLCASVAYIFFHLSEPGASPPSRPNILRTLFASFMEIGRAHV